MRKNTKIITGSIVALAVIVVLGIVYAAFTQQLTINGTATGRSSSWKIYFSRLTGPTLNGTAKQITAPTIQNNATKIGDYEVTVTSPGDYIEYEFDVTNDGDYDATLTNLSMNSNTELTYEGSGDNEVNDENNVKSQIEYTLKYKADGTTVSQNDTLKSKETKTMLLRLTYKSFNDATLLPKADVAISGLGISLTYTQDGNAKVNPNGTTPYVPTYDAYAVGDRIQIEGDTSGDYYRVIAASGTTQDYVVALKENPLTADEVTQAGGTTPATGSYPGIMHYGSNSTYAASDIKSVVDAWAADKFTDELKTVDGYSARLIQFSELTGNLGYELDNGATSFKYISSSSTPSWAYSSDYDYWTMTPYQDGGQTSDSHLWDVHNDGSLSDYYAIGDNGAVRPVINVLKTAITSSQS